jgi:hypothetical protein
MSASPEVDRPALWGYRPQKSGQSDRGTSIAPVRRPVLTPSLLAVLAASAAATPAPAAADPRVTAAPNPVPFGEQQTVKGRGWPVIEFCSRTVRLSRRSDQNAFRIGTDRVTTRGRFRFTWTPRRADVGRGNWTLVARMRCESGEDGSPNPMHATTPIRIGASRLVVGRGRTSNARWTLFTRRSARWGLCLGLEARPLGAAAGGSGEGCGGGLRGRALDLSLSAFRDEGTFAYGRVARRVGRVEVTFGEGAPMEARILAGEPMLGFHGRYWIAPFDGQCAIVSARAFDGEGNPLGRVRIPERPPPKPGQPDPQPREDCPKAP